MAGRVHVRCEPELPLAADLCRARGGDFMPSTSRSALLSGTRLVRRRLGEGGRTGRVIENFHTVW